MKINERSTAVFRFNETNRCTGINADDIAKSLANEIPDYETRNILADVVTVSQISNAAVQSPQTSLG